MHTVVCGLNAIARAAHAKKSEIEVLTIGGEKDSLTALRELEQKDVELCRKLIEAQVVQFEKKTGAPKKKRSSTKPLPAEKVAAELGVPPEQFKAAEKAAREKVAAETKAPIYSYGIQQSQEWLSYVQTIRQAVIDATNAIATAQRAIGALDEFQILRVAEFIQKPMAYLLANLAELKPREVCPFCKNLPAYSDKCQCCQGEGWVGQIDQTMIPAQLLSDAPLYVMPAAGELIEINREELGESVEEEIIDLPGAEIEPTEEELEEWDDIL